MPGSLSSLQCNDRGSALSMTGCARELARSTLRALLWALRSGAPRASALRAAPFRRRLAELGHDLRREEVEELRLAGPDLGHVDPVVTGVDIGPYRVDVRLRVRAERKLR